MFVYLCFEIPTCKHWWKDPGQGERFKIRDKKRTVAKKQRRKRPYIAQLVKCLPAMQETRVRFLGWEDPLEKGKAPHSNILAWRIPRAEEPGGLQSMGSQKCQTQLTDYKKYSTQRERSEGWAVLNGFVGFAAKVWKRPYIVPLEMKCKVKSFFADEWGGRLFTDF